MKEQDTTLEQAIAGIAPLDEVAMEAARRRQRELLKPAGSLGELETIAIRVAGITGKVRNTLGRKVHFLFGSDHGVYAEGVSASPQSFTKTLMELYARNGGGAINVLCRRAGVELRLFDLGVKGLPAPCPGIDARYKLMPEGTEDFARLDERGEPLRAMPLGTAREAVELGMRLVREAARDGARIVGAGEVGMGNTTPAAACILAALGSHDPGLVGRGGGLTDEAFARKKQVILQALERHQPDPDDPLDILSRVGGLDIAAMTGVFLGAALCRLPAVIDGVIAIAAALLAVRLAPLCREYLFASHRSLEPAYAAAEEALGLHPFLGLRMRLGEGTGCPLAMQVIEDALALMNEMGTFDEIGLESAYRAELKP